MSLILLALLGCDPDGKTPGTTASFEVTASAALSDTAPTVVKLTWETTADSVDDATVLIETASGESWSEPLADASATLWGFKTDEEVTLTVSVTSGDETGTSEPVTLTTGPLPSDLGPFTLSGDPEGALDGGLVLTTNIQTPQVAMLLDEDGDYRWWVRDTEAAQVGRARLSVDGESVLVMPINTTGGDETGIKRFSLEGELLETILFERMHHDFVEHSDGTIAFIARETREYEGSAFHGDKIIEYSPDGEFTEIWNVWDHFEPYPGKTPDASEWTHSNALLFDEEAQTYTIGNYGLHNIVHVDRDTGDVLWVFSGIHSDFTDTEGDYKLIEESHQFQFLDGSLLIFENGSSARQASRAVEFSFDPDEPVVEEIWEYSPDPSLYTLAMGDIERFDSGNTLVDFSVSGQMVEVDPSGEMLWQLNTSLGAAFGYMEVLHGIAGR